MNRVSDLGDFHGFWDQALTQCNRLEFVVHAHTQMRAYMLCIHFRVTWIWYTHTHTSYIYTYKHTQYIYI